jgi:hypothetical protein
MARAATRAGLVVIGAELQDSVAAEQRQMHQDALLVSWRRCRADLANAREETRQDTFEKLLRVLEQISKDENDLIDRIGDPGRQEALASDLVRYRRILQRRAPDLDPDPGPPGSRLRLG